MKTVVVLVGWLLTLAAAFFVGGMLTEQGASESPGRDTADEVAKLRSQVDELRSQLEEERTRTPRSRAAVVSGGPREVVADRGAGDAAADDGSPGEEIDPADIPDEFSLEGMTDASQASAAFMAFVKKQLGRGDEGHAAILRAINQIWQEKEMMQSLFSDESVAVRELYPWVKFLVNREAEVVDMSEYVFRTMAEDPGSLDYVADNDVLEIFTQGVGILLPGAVGADRLAVFRGYAEKMLATPADSQPKAVAQNRDEIGRLLAKFWAAPISPEEALAKLREGNLPPEQIAQLLRRVPADQMGSLDVTTLILPLVRTGNNELLRALPALSSIRLDMGRIDQALLEGIDEGKVHAWFASRLQQAGGRKSWTEVRPFVDRALLQGEKTANAAAQMLVSYLPQDLRPDAVYVRDLLSRGIVNDTWAEQLRRVYKVE